MGLVAHPVFKTARAEQPSAWKVRFLRRSVACVAPARAVKAGAFAPELLMAIPHPVPNRSTALEYRKRLSKVARRPRSEERSMRRLTMLAGVATAAALAVPAV